MKQTLGFISAFLGLSFVGHPLSALPSGAPPSMQWEGKTVVPVDFHQMNLHIVFDVSTETATANASISFHAPKAGYPMLDLVPEASSVALNGSPITNNPLPEINDPNSITRFRVLNAPVFENSFNELEIAYRFPSSEVTYTSGGVRVGFFMSDVGVSQQRGFLEKYAPANFEYDAFRLVVSLEVTGSQSTHRVFTNGKVESENGNRWEILFPNYFTSSSIYLHLTNRNFYVKSENYAGQNKSIPITVYASTDSLATRGMTNSKEVMSELESTYGPFAHERIVAYITPSGGGMEYCGATITSLWALEHEFTHFWFARGVMPANGNAGWIDEAIASWRDNGYPTNTSIGNSGPTLGGFGDFQRNTPNAAYSSGARLMAHLNHLFASNGGLKTILRSLFSTHQQQTITTRYFQDFLEDKTGTDLENLFDRHVYGKRQERKRLWDFTHSPLISKHPRPFTREEYKRLR